MNNYKYKKIFLNLKTLRLNNIFFKQNIKRKMLNNIF